MPDPNEPIDQQTTVATTEPAADAPATSEQPAAEPAQPEVDPIEATIAAANGEAAAESAAPAAPAQEPAAADPAQPAAPAAAQPPADPAEQAKQEKAKVDAEIAELGIKNERTAARFHELSARAAEVEPLKKTVAELEVFRQRAVEWEEAVTSTGATPEQFGQTMTYLSMLNSGDPGNYEKAFEMIEREYHSLAELLGKTAGGAVDPLKGHPDLQAKVASMDMDRETALAWAEERNKTKLVTAASSTREQQAQQFQQQQEAARAQQEGLAAVAQLGEQLRATDPHFATKFQILQPMLETMQAQYPPHQWAGLVQQMWSRIPAPVAAAPVATAQRTVTPMRPGVSSANQVRSITDPIEATMAAAMGTRPV